MLVSDDHSHEPLANASVSEQQESERVSRESFGERIPRGPSDLILVFFGGKSAGFSNVIDTVDERVV